MEQQKSVMEKIGGSLDKHKWTFLKVAGALALLEGTGATNFVSDTIDPARGIVEATFGENALFDEAVVSTWDAHGNFQFDFQNPFESPSHDFLSDEVQKTWVENADNISEPEAKVFETALYRAISNDENYELADGNIDHTSQRLDMAKVELIGTGSNGLRNISNLDHDVLVELFDKGYGEQLMSILNPAVLTNDFIGQLHTEGVIDDVQRDALIDNANPPNGRANTLSSLFVD